MPKLRLRHQTAACVQSLHGLDDQTRHLLFSRDVQYLGSVRIMAARRSLGGGRVLGSGKNLAPPVPVKPQLRSSGALSPSSSSISLSSQTSSTPISTENEDITARVALDEHGTAQAAAAASSRMVCPICNDEMVCKVNLRTVSTTLTYSDDTAPT